MNYVTIATDVSCDDKYKISVWAFYIRHAGGVIKRTGQFKQYYNNTAQAETYALINALTVARKEVPTWKNSTVIIHNEIEHVLTPVTTKAGNVKLRDKDRTEAIRTIALPILSEAYAYERRKIKAHYRYWRESSNPAKYAINRWCDQESRATMKSIRKGLKRKKHLTTTG